MTAIADGPGKTAPKLVNDFLRFDPTKADPSASFLTKVTPPVGEGPQLQPDARSCQHEYTEKNNQIALPDQYMRSRPGGRHRLAVCCKKCRIHADLRIAYYDVATNPCPNSEDPLHHFIRSEDVDTTSDQRIQYGWQCSAAKCQAQVTIAYRRPRITEEERKALTDTERLRRAYEAMVKDNPAREGLKQATPVDVLARLRKYVKDSLDPVHAIQNKRFIPADNKRFGEAFGLYGRDFDQLLNRLGFRFEEAQGANDANWHLPNPPPLESRSSADGSTQRELLEDVETELRALLYKVSGETGLANPLASEDEPAWPSADKDAERTLSAQGYLRAPTTRRQVASAELLPYFASLGIQPDSADSIVVWAFDKQAETDPARQTYYYECLQMIEESRKTEDLQTKLAILESGGLVSRRDVQQAYRYLDIPESEATNSDDERILNLFYVRTSDSGPEAKIEARTALKKIGQARGSARLMRAAEQTIETMEEALGWLGNGANNESADDFLIIIAATKLEENVELTRTAMGVIARDRKSDAINSWLLNGQGDEMSLQDALTHCQVPEPWSSIADKSIFANWFFPEARRVNAGSPLTEKAIAVIERAIQAEASSSHSLETWPVGLTSHGNTCYLNSLLQYYFSIKPLRDIVLNYDKYELDTEQHATKDERVGNRKISTEEVKGGQRFAKDLKQLFERMIKSRDEHVRPQDDLVCRAFLEMKDYALLASTVREAKADHEANGVLGQIEEEKPEDMDKLSAPAGLERHESNASSVTLQGDQDVPMQNGELPPTPPESPTKEDVPELTVAPPLPPRRFSTTREHALEKAQDKAKAQQDVTEVHDDVLFKLRAGMMPDGVDSSGEQEDQLRRLFRYSVVETAVKDGVDGKKKELLDMAIVLPPPSEDTDIYTMLDQVFDLQSMGETTEAGVLEGYKSLQSLPPLLQINITRIDYDKEKGSFKSDKAVTLFDELYLDRYVDTSHDQVLAKRRACWKQRQQLHSSRKERKALYDAPAITDKPSDLNGTHACTEAGGYLAKLPDVNDDLASIGIEGLDVPVELINTVITDSLAQEERLDSLEREIKNLEHQLKDQFSEFKDIRYRLAAVFFHRGSYGHGHYWIYIHDFENNMWRLYNDEKVEEFKNENDILNATTWHHGTPTFAVYVRDDQKTEIIQPVCRSPESEADHAAAKAAQASLNHDIEMENMATSNGTVNPQHTMVQLDGTQESNGKWDEKRWVAGTKW